MQAVSHMVGMCPCQGVEELVLIAVVVCGTGVRGEWCEITRTFCTWVERTIIAQTSRAIVHEIVPVITRCNPTLPPRMNIVQTERQ